MHQIGNLRDGTAVKVVGLEHLLKDVVAVYSTDCGTLIRGMHRQSRNDPWLPIGQNYVISRNTHVEIDQEHREKNEEKKSRKKGGFKFPSGEFTTKMMAELNNVSIPYANIMIRKNQDCALVRKEGGKKGKPANWYQIK